MSELLLLHIFIQAKFVSLLAAQVEDLNKMFFSELSMMRGL